MKCCTRYESLSFAIDLIESIRRALGENGNDSRRTGDHIQNLQELARDVRYGGKWEDLGEAEEIAGALDCCGEGLNCTICPRRREMETRGGCPGNLKRDAAAMIRAMAKKIREAETGTNDI